MKPLPIWPPHIARTPAAARRRSQFGDGHSGDVSPLAARAFLIDELERFGATEIQLVPSSPEAGVWFRLDGQWRVLCCDCWLTLGENLRALGLTAQAMRGLERWGVADVVSSAMQGFLALPAGENEARQPPRAPEGTPERGLSSGGYGEVHPVRASAERSVAASWRTVLGAQALGNDLVAIKRRYRELAKIVHPDAGGRDAYAARLNAAMEAAERELGGQP